MNKKLQDASRLCAALDAKDFMRRHGASLSEVLHLLGGNSGLELYCAADRLLDGLSPDPVRVGKALRDMCDLLSEADSPEERYAASLRWHGARLNDLAAVLLQ